MFKRLLIANRGEIAVRIVRACRTLGIDSVAVYSDADVKALHVTLADYAVHIGAAVAAQSYLSAEKIIAAARATNADAIHPGYGFLAEDAAFASVCHDAHIAFVGPPADAILRLGVKIAARDLARNLGIPVVPGETPVSQDDAAIASAARRVGFPVLLKPSAGGGGIGMKAVYQEAALAAGITQARREAAAAFGTGTLYVERLIERPRHVEVQIAADHHGGCVHLSERECSLQRRHQKVVEEAPSPTITPQLRARLGDAAVRLARAADYRNVGTVEFLVDGSGENASFYFLETNTRLQVEHPVTEQLTGVDLVQAQILIASGEPLPWAQDALSPRGHAIEARIYAEDPAHDHLPQAGRLLLYREPSMPGIRVDSGVGEGDELSVHYDPLIAKLIASGETREAARRRAVEALRDFPILGVKTNAAFLIELLEHPQFVAGTVDTTFIHRERGALVARLTSDVPAEALAVAACVAEQRSAMALPFPAFDDPWMSLKGWRG